MHCAISSAGKTLKPHQLSISVCYTNPNANFCKSAECYLSGDRVRLCSHRLSLLIPTKPGEGKFLWRMASVVVDSCGGDERAGAS